MNYIFILGFANQTTLNRTMYQFKETYRSNAEIVILDNHYPINIEENAIENWAKVLNATHLDAGKNLGLHEGLNYMCQEMDVKRNDKVIGFDPDTKPVTIGWDIALFDALDIPGCGWASLWNEHSAGEMRQRGYTEFVHKHMAGEHRYWKTHAPVVNSICAFNMDWVYAEGGFSEPTEFYGGLECAMWVKLKKHKKDWIWLCNAYEGKFDIDLQDPEYKAYKWAHAHQGWKGDFALWINGKNM